MLGDLAKTLGYEYDPQTSLLTRIPIIQHSSNGRKWNDKNVRKGNGAGCLLEDPVSKIRFWVYNVHLTAYPYAPYFARDYARDKVLIVFVPGVFFFPFFFSVSVFVFFTAVTFFLRSYRMIRNVWKK